jgi:hypothetical protein
MDDFPMDDIGMPSDAGELQGDMPEIADMDVDQTLEDPFPSDEIAFDDIGMVDNTDVSNFNESGLTNTEEVTGYIKENIPPEHLEDLDSIEYVDDQSAYEQGTMGQWANDEEIDITTIEVYPHDNTGELYDTIAHEVGHNAENNLSPDLVDQWNDLYSQSFDNYLQSEGEQNEFITGYATMGPDEDFAETYAFYINDPPLVQSVSPDKYDFMKDNVFGGREF